MKKMKLTGKKIFIAGHNGLVGSSLVREMNSIGIKPLTVEREDLDLLYQDRVEKWFEVNKPEIVILAAAKVGGIYANDNYPVQFILENLRIQTNVIESSFKFKVKKLLFLGSSCIYPKVCPQPIKEEYLLSSKLEPTNESYAVAKIAGLKLCQAYSKQYGCNFFAVMPTNVYGPNDNFHPVDSHVPAALMRRFHFAKIENKESVDVWGTGNARREFMYVDDLAKSCIFLLKNYSGYNPINSGTGVDISIREFAELMKEIIGFKGDIVFDNSKPDGTILKRLDTSIINDLGWKPNTDLRSGLIKTYDWAIKNKIFE